MPRTIKEVKITNAEWILIMAACEQKLKSPAVVGDKKFEGHLRQIIKTVGASVGGLPGEINPDACEIDNILDESDWNEVYYALDWVCNIDYQLANPDSLKFIKNKHARKSGPEAKALIEKIGPDGGKMY